MKKKYLSFLVVLLLLLLTSTGFAAVNNKYFRADKQYYDVETGTYVINGNIIINLSNGSISGDKAQVKLSTLEFWGTGGWMLKQYDVTFRGESAYVVFGKNIAMIEGGVDFKRSELQITSDKVDYNWKTKVASFKGNVKVFASGAPTLSSDTVKFNVATNEFVN